MTIDQDVNDFITAGGTKPAKFENVGDKVSGTVVSANVQQARDFDTQELAVWKDGNPRMQVFIVLQTDEHDDAEDDGKRGLYANKPSAMLTAIRDAVKLSGGKLEAGGTLAVQFTGLGAKTKPQYNAPKEYRAQYKVGAPPALAEGDLI